MTPNDAKPERSEGNAGRSRLATVLSVAAFVGIVGTGIFVYCGCMSFLVLSLGISV